MRTSKLSTILTKEMLEYNYNLYGSMQKMADALNISIDSIYKYMKLYNIKYNQHYVGLYECDHHLFSRDDERSFYLAGFIAADGSLQNRKYSKILKITLSEKDYDHLYNIKNILKSNNPIIKYKVKPSKLVKSINNCVQLQIVSKDIYSDLSRFNIVPNKTFIYYMPEWLINHPLINHFMRGYFDGDGSFSYCGLGPNRIVKQMSFNLLGTELFIKQYKAILEQKCVINIAKIIKRKNIYLFNYSGNINIAKITKFLYKDATIYLNRKYDKIKHLSIYKHYIRMKKENKEDFWITNITRKEVHLVDIGVRIKPMRSLNLLDKRHYSITKEQLDKSATSGYLFTRKNDVVIRKVPPLSEQTHTPLIDRDAVFQTRQRSSVELENIKYEELDVSDDEYAEENSDTAETDHLGKWNK
jgi:hypothetical protein